MQQAYQIASREVRPDNQGRFFFFKYPYEKCMQLKCAICLLWQHQGELKKRNGWIIQSSMKGTRYGL